MLFRNLTRAEDARTGMSVHRDTLLARRCDCLLVSKGKPPVRGGRKASGLKLLACLLEIAGLPAPRLVMGRC